MAQTATDDSSQIPRLKRGVGVAITVLIALVHGAVGLTSAASLFLLNVNSPGATVCTPDEFTQREF